jgi:hypothetical protein
MRYSSLWIVPLAVTLIAAKCEPRLSYEPRPQKTTHHRHRTESRRNALVRAQRSTYRDVQERLASLKQAVKHNWSATAANDAVTAVNFLTSSDAYNWNASTAKRTAPLFVSGPLISTFHWRVDRNMAIRVSMRFAQKMGLGNDARNAAF